MASHFRAMIKFFFFDPVAVWLDTKKIVFFFIEFHTFDDILFHDFLIGYLVWIPSFYVKVTAVHFTRLMFLF